MSIYYNNSEYRKSTFNMQSLTPIALSTMIKLCYQKKDIYNTVVSETRGSHIISTAGFRCCLQISYSCFFDRWSEKAESNRESYILYSLFAWQDAFTGCASRSLCYCCVRKVKTTLCPPASPRLSLERNSMKQSSAWPGGIFFLC